MNVSQLMNRSVETCGPDESLADAARRMWNSDIGCLAVVDGEGNVLGMVTDRDVCMAALMEGRPLHDIAVSRAMSKEVHCCAPSDSLIAAEEQMRSRQVRRLPVLDAAGQLVGMVSLNDLAREAERHVGRKGRAVSAEEITVTLAAVSRSRQVKELAIPLAGS
jgi:CBS domain-containing protein